MEPDVLRRLELLAGAAHRLAWRGPDPSGDRRFAADRLRAEIGAASPALAAFLDWWQVCALGSDPVDRAWSIDRELPGPLGDALKAILESEGRLREVRRPALLAEVLDELRRASDRNPGNIAPAKAVYQEANDECKRVIRAARDGAPPPFGLRLVDLDAGAAEAWASEGTTGARRVEPGTPVWDHLVKGLLQRSSLVERALAAWPRSGARPPPALPAGWQEILRGATGAEVAVALAADAVPDPPDRPLLDAAAARTLLRELTSLPPVARFRLAREAWLDDPEDRPAWLLSVQQRLDGLAREIESRDGYVADAAVALGAARQHLADADLDGAAQWLAEADQEHRRHATGTDRLKRRQRGLDLAAQLTAPLPETSDLDAWLSAVDNAFAAERAALRTAVDELGAAGQPVDRARSALERGQLGAARLEIAAARERGQAARASEDARLGPELAAVRARIASLHDKIGFEDAIHRVASRRAAGLSADAGELVQLLDLLERKAAPAAVLRDDPSTRRRAGWVLGGVESSGEDARGYATRVKGVRVTAGPPHDASARVASWGEVVTESGAAVGERLIYRREGSLVSGPWALGPAGPRAEDPSGAVGVLGEERFAELFGWIDLDSRRAVVPQPPSLAELVTAGATVRDTLDDETLAGWLATALGGAPPAHAISAWMATLRDLPPAVAAARAARLGDLLGHASALEAAREAAIRGFLESPAGLAVVRDRTEEGVRAEIARRRADIDASLAGARARLDEARAQLAAEEEGLRARLTDLQTDLRNAEEMLADRKLLLLAELGIGRATSGPALGPTPAPLRAVPFDATEAPDLPGLIRILAGTTWPPDQVANLVLSIATGRWTLLAGLPGVGKSTFVRSVLSRLGHGPGTDRYLELVVRRDWQDDAPLFGFWHPTERVWSPSSEGFVEHLLRAADDARLGYGGMWPVLIEELNLASPEYYLARPISALEAPVPLIRLYDEALDPGNAARYPASFPIPDSVRLVATVNVDDTVERLSPRFLSRASVVWVEPRRETPAWRPEDDATDLRIRWATLAGLAREADGLGPVHEVVDFLLQHRIAGAPTVRTARAIGRYLAASRGLMAPADAEDLQILQRVLPPIRGTGPRWRELLDRLGELVARRGWRRSAERIRDLRVRGEELGDWYDFFHA